MSILAKMAVQITADVARFAAGMDSVDKRLGKFDRMVSGLGRTMIGVFGAQMVFNGLKDAVNIMASFEVQMSTVRAITGATGDQFAALEKNALDLGRSTRYTATQVGQLQVEFGRLGFSTKEIVNATKATLNLATASGSDLARSAEIAGSTLRAFQIDASEMGRVTDVMASGFNTSALGLENFAEAIKYVSPVAKAVNVSLEETTAMLAVLADAGIKGSQAGTSLRRIFTQLTADGRPLSARLDELASKGITLANANDEVGLYAQTALLVLGNQNDKIKELTETYKNANGETQRMADIMEDNLSGSVTKLTSAWEGLILKFKDSTGPIRQGVDLLTDVLTVLNNLNPNTEKAKQALSLYVEQLKFANPALKAFETTLSLIAPWIKKQADEVAKLDDAQAKANDEQQKYITQSATVLLKDYGYDIVAITSALYDNKDAFAILSEIEKIHTQEVKSSAEAEAERLRGVQKSIDKMKEMEMQLYKNAKAESEKNEDRFSNTSGLRQDVMNQFGIGGDGKSFDASDPMGYVFDTSGLEEYVSFYEQMGETIEEFTERILKNKEAVTENRFEFARFADQVGNSLSQAIRAEISFAQAFARVTASILDGIQARIVANIAEGSSKAFAKNPILGIAVVTAGFAIAKGLLGMIGKNSGSVGGGYHSGGSGRVNTDVYGRVGIGSSQNSVPNITGVIKGEDLWVILQNYQRNNKYTSALG